MPTQSKAIWIEVRKDSGRILRLEGDKATLFWDQILRAADVAAYYGYPFRGPMLEVASPPSEGQGSAALEPLTEEGPANG